MALGYASSMHEMSIAESIVAIVEEELLKHNCHKLTLVRIHYGALSQIVPDSLRFCFEALLMNTPHVGATLELECLPLVLRCSSCENEFTPPEQDIFAPCPQCQACVGHCVEQGRELFVQHLEAE